MGSRGEERRKKKEKGMGSRVFQEQIPAVTLSLPCEAFHSVHPPLHPPHCPLPTAHSLGPAPLGVGLAVVGAGLILVPGARIAGVTVIRGNQGGIVGGFDATQKVSDHHALFRRGALGLDTDDEGDGGIAGG